VAGEKRTTAGTTCPCTVQASAGPTETARHSGAAVIGQERTATCAACAAEITAAHSASHVSPAERSGAPHASTKCAAVGHSSHARPAHSHVAAAKRTASHVASECSALHPAHAGAAHAAEMRAPATHVSHAAAEVRSAPTEMASATAEVTSAATHMAPPTTVAASPSVPATAATAATASKTLVRNAEQGCRDQRHAYRDQSFNHDTSPFRL
jgi:hypothetical protein